jgi:two-component system copper resistance phosphate regulon response regulator CusR
MHVLLAGVPLPHPGPIAQALRAQGDGADIADSAADAARRVLDFGYDAVVLALPTADHGDPAFVGRVRNCALDSGILALAPAHDVARIVRIMDSGADDCMVMPFHIDELLARLRALSRRRQHSHGTVLRVDDLEVHPTNRTVRRGGRTIPLTTREFAVLRFLVHHRGEVVSRHAINNHLYDIQDDTQSNIVEVYIHRLRTKIDAGAARPLILTCWGQGYLLRGESG